METGSGDVYEYSMLRSINVILLNAKFVWSQVIYIIRMVNQKGESCW
jgi:hypothetical protein